MLFNSLVFAAFFCAVYAAYLMLRNRLRAQNLLLLAASYVFYGYWDWRFLGLLFFSTAVDYVVALRLRSEERPGVRKALLWCSLVANLGALGFFKYFNFFADSLVSLMNAFGAQADPFTLRIVLPVGISFYTFQTMSYTLDVYWNKMKPSRDFAEFALFVSFFPQLVAGPIERATRLLPQIAVPRRVTATQVSEGIQLLFWGYFKKVVVADNMGAIADRVFNAHADYGGLDAAVGILAFAGQIYGDFSGYSDIARGLAKLMGFELTVNFNLPYFAQTPGDFWRRWHISLSEWLRDYLYIPLGGNRRGPRRASLNLMLTMLLGGLWHGAAWHFALWGGYHGALLVAYRLLGIEASGAPPRGEPGMLRAHASRLSKTAVMFCLTLVGWALFRASTAQQAWEMLSGLTGGLSAEGAAMLADVLFFAAPVAALEWYQHRRGDLLAPAHLGAAAKAAVYGLLAVCILVFRVRGSVEFIYFQF